LEHLCLCFSRNSLRATPLLVGIRRSRHSNLQWKVWRVSIKEGLTPQVVPPVVTGGSSERELGLRKHAFTCTPRDAFVETSFCLPSTCQGTSVITPLMLWRCRVVLSTRSTKKTWRKQQFSCKPEPRIRTQDVQTDTWNYHATLVRPYVTLSSNPFMTLWKYRIFLVPLEPCCFLTA